MQTVEIRKLVTETQLDLFQNEIVGYMEDWLDSLLHPNDDVEPHLTPQQTSSLTEQLAHEIALKILRAHANGESTY